MAKNTVISLFTLLFLVSCASNNYTDAPPTLGALYSKYAYIGYSGKLRLIDDVGIVTTDGLVQITEVDGVAVNKLHAYKSKGFYFGGRVQLHLLPGTHRLILGYYDDRGNDTARWSKDGYTLQFTIAKNQVIHLRGIQNGYSWDGKMHDGSSALSIITKDFKVLTKK